jgi:hypothetical protein
MIMWLIVVPVTFIGGFLVASILAVGSRADECAECRRHIELTTCHDGYEFCAMCGTALGAVE